MTENKHQQFLSIERCQAVLNDDSLSEENVVEIRDTLYGFSYLLIEKYIREKLPT